MAMTQNQRVLLKLQQAGSQGVSNAEFNNDMHIFRYSARIDDLRRQGHKIESVHVKGSKWVFIFHPPMTTESANQYLEKLKQKEQGVLL